MLSEVLIILPRSSSAAQTADSHAASCMVHITAPLTEIVGGCTNSGFSNRCWGWNLMKPLHGLKAQEDESTRGSSAWAYVQPRGWGWTLMKPLHERAHAQTGP